MKGSDGEQQVAMLVTTDRASALAAKAAASAIPIVFGIGADSCQTA